MRFVLFFWLAVLATTIAAWEKEDHEIFDLVSAVEASEGKGTTFYSWLNVPSTASTNEIAKAYRKLSMQLHPDKNPGDNKIHERFARLGVVSSILRNKEGRERYDFFYKNGVPKWRGTGYYYSRFRPGLGSVFAFLVLATSGLQYIVHGLNYKRDLKRVEKIMNDARLAAWGAKMTPTEGKRKVKVNLGGPRRIDDDGNVSQGRLIDMVVEGENVFILDPSGDMELLDTSAAIPASISRIWAVRLTLSLYRIFATDKAQQEVDVDEADITDDGEDLSASDVPSGTTTPSSKGKSLGPVSKTGGKRRKVQRKR